MSEYYDYSELRAEIESDPAREHDVRQRTDVLRAEYEDYQATLGQLRRARDLTQTQLAQILDISQPEVSRIERQTDLYLSTLRNYVRAMGGRLDLAATFHTAIDEHVVLLRIGDVTEADSRSDLPDIADVKRADARSAAFDLTDASASAIIEDSRWRHDALRRSADEALRAGSINLACVLNALAAEATTAQSDVGEDMASRAYGGAAAFARQYRKPRFAESLWRRSLDVDPTNMRSRACLGQLLHHQGRHDEAIEHLGMVAKVDNRTRLSYGWSLLLAATDEEDEEQHQQGLSELIDALHVWAYNAPETQRDPWLRHVQRLAKLGSECETAAHNLLKFATSNAKWGPLDPKRLLEADANSDQDALGGSAANLTEDAWDDGSPFAGDAARGRPLE